MKRFMLFSLMLMLMSILTGAEEIETIIAKGDSAYDLYDDDTALVYYENAIALDSSSCEALWKASRSAVNVGELGSDDDRDRLYPLAVTLSRKAVALCPDHSDANLSLAIAVGRLALMRGGKTKVELSKEVKEYALKAIELDPENDIAYHVLGRWNREVASLSGLIKALAKVIYGGLPDASKERARELFQQAVALDPNYINHHLELGITYESLEEWEKAKESYETVLRLPAEMPRDKNYKMQAGKRLLDVKKHL